MAATSSAPVPRRENRHADSAIECAQHLGFRHLAGLREPFEDARNVKGGKIQRDADALGEDAGKIVGKAAAGDMGEGADMAACA